MLTPFLMACIVKAVVLNSKMILCLTALLSKSVYSEKECIIKTNYS